MINVKVEKNTGSMAKRRPLRFFGAILVFALVFAGTAGSAWARYGGARSWAFKGLRPTKGPWGTVVTLQGYGFTKKVKVYYDGKLIKPRSVGKTFIRVVVPKGAKSGWFSVRRGKRTLRAPTRFKVVNRPTPQKLVPKASPPNTWITLKGAHFVRSMKFWIGRVALKRRYVSRTEIKLFVHRGVRSGRLHYKWKGRRRRTKLRFSMTKLPKISGFGPRRGWRGDVVSFKGRHFCSNPLVTLDGDKVPVVGKTSPRMLKVKIPKGVSTGSFVVKCYGRSFKVPGTFTVKPPFAKVTKVQPSSGVPGAWVRIRGQGFKPKDRFWIGRTLLQTKFVSDKLVRAKISGGARTGEIYFQSFGKRFGTDKKLTVYRKPVIQAVRPSSGWYGEEVKLVGRNFCPGITVTLRKRKVKVVSRKGSRQISVRVPKGARGGRFKVSCFKWNVTAPKAFKLEPPKSLVQSVRPLKGPPGTKLTVSGKGLKRSDVFFLGSKRMPMTYKGGSRVQLVVPRGAKSGPIVHKSYGRRKRTRFVFKVAWPRPIVASFKPKVAWYGEVVTLTGRRICPKPKVTIRKKPLRVLKSDSDSVKVRLPKGIKAGNLVLRCRDHRVMVRPALKVRPPYGRVFSIHPKSGPSGTWVTLTGDNFKRSDRFYLGRRRLKVKFVGSHQVKVQIPEKAKSGNFVMFSAGKRRVTKHSFKVAIVSPVVRDFSPRSGWYGDTVTVKGKHFCLSPKVLFSGGNKGAKVLKRLGHTTLKIEVPKGAQTGALTVSCYGKTGRSSKYFVLSPPLAHVSSVTPDRGPWNRWITLRGRNFTKKTKFYLNRTRLKVSYKGPRKVQVFIPPGAKSGLIYVESYGRRKDTSFTYVVRKKKKKKRPRGR